jgi:hypothetical protein
MGYALTFVTSGKYQAAGRRQSLQHKGHSIQITLAESRIRFVRANAAPPLFTDLVLEIISG